MYFQAGRVFLGCRNGRHVALGCFQRVVCAKAGMGKGPVSADEVALMSPEDVFLYRQQYSAYLGRLFNRAAHVEGSAAHAELLQIVTLWVRQHTPPIT